MPSIRFTCAFRKDYDRNEGNHEAVLRLEEVISALETGQTLPTSFRDHKLVGNLTRCRECHLRPDVILLYEITLDTIIFHRLGSHAELFKH
jgi:mRNA interferase YafQ